MLLRPWILLLLLVLLSSSLYAQNQERAKLDSVQRSLLSVSLEDTSKVNNLSEVSKAYHTINPDSGIIYGKICLKLAEDLKWDLGIAKAYNALAMNYEAQSNNPTALGYYIQSLTIFEKLKDNSKIALLNGNIGNVYNSLQNYPRALEYAMKTLNYHSSHSEDYYKTHESEKKEKAENIGNIAVIYDNLHDSVNAEKYYNEAIKIDEQINAKADIAKNLGNIATLKYGQKKYREAINLGNKALSIYEELGDRKSTALNNSNLGWYHVETSRDSTDMINSTGQGKKNNLSKAIAYFNKAIAISKEIGYQEGLTEGYGGMKEAYTLLHDYKTAIEYFLLFSNIKDSINSTENKIKVAKIESDLRNARERENVAKIELKNARMRIYFIIGIFTLVIVIIVVVRYLLSQVKSNRQLAKERKKHIERIRAQKTVLKDIAYIQSHEVRGPVSTILGLTQLFNYEDLADPTNGELMEGITTVANRLDKIVTEVVNKENKLNTADEIESDKEDNI